MMVETKIIAEIGTNWTSVEEAKEMIRRASEAGAGYVKFQAYDSAAIGRLPAKVRHHLEEVMLTEETARELMAHAWDCGVTWFATPTSEARVDFLEGLGVELYKVREKDSHNLPLLKKIRELGKTMIISSQTLPQDLYMLYDPKIVWAYCIPKYPPLLGELNLAEKIPAFRGYSNHYPGIAPPLFAGFLGAEWIECHVTLDKARPDVDQAVSITFEELARLCSLLKDFGEMRGIHNEA